MRCQFLQVLPVTVLLFENLADPPVHPAASASRQILSDYL
jgi:hypothetical protein